MYCMTNKNIKVSDICRALNLTFKGPDNIVQSLNLCNRQTKFDFILSYATSPKYCNSVISNPKITAVVLDQKCYQSLCEIKPGYDESVSIIIVDKPEFVFYDIHEYLYKQQFYSKNNNKPIIGRNCNIHPTAVVEDNVVIGDNVIIGANTVINSGVVIEEDVEIGCNSVIGGHGFQALKDYPMIVHHIGGVLIHKGVYIGNLTTVSRSLFEGYTEVGEYSKIDDHVHFSHNCKCGKLCTLTAGTVLMGSVEIGDNVWISPSSLILNKKHIGDNSFIGSMSYVNSEVKPKSLMMGIPAKCFNK